jgi:hypothetical protein
VRSLLASGQAQSRREVAQLLGGHGTTIGHGLALYAAGGLEALLAVAVPAGTPPSRPPGVVAAMAQALRQPAGVASSAGLRPWGQQPCPLAVHSHTRSTIVRTRFKAKRKGPRPTPTKTP